MTYKWEVKFKEMGHKPVLTEDGEIDIFVLDIDGHNGPGCTKCGYSFCHHCNPFGENIPVCMGVCDDDR